MSIISDEPLRAIRNAMERLALAAANTDVERHVAAERAIVEEALLALGAKPEPEQVAQARRCSVCGFVALGEDDLVCPRCDLFGAPSSHLNRFLTGDDEDG
jgi:rubrerythrin